MRIQGWACCFVSIASIMVTGCATHAGQAGLQCGLGGAAVGYLACKLAGGSDKDCAAVGVGTGVAGAIACSMYVKNLDSRRKALEGKENDLDAQIAYVQGLNSDTQTLNGELSKRVANITADTDKVVAQIGQLNPQQVAQVRQQRDDLVKVSQQEVTHGQEALQTAKTLRTQQPGKSTELDAAIAKQEQLLAEAQKQVSLLAAQRARV